MGCACKGGENKEIESVKIEETNILIRIFNFFIISILLVIVGIFAFIGAFVLVFNQTVLNKTNKISDIIKVLLYFKDKIIRKNKDDDEDDDEDEGVDFNEDDYEVVGMEKIEKNE